MVKELLQSNRELRDTIDVLNKNAERNDSEIFQVKN